MTKPDLSPVDAYIAAQHPTVQDALNRVRSAIRKALPQAEETISYKMPTYKLYGRAAVYFAAWKDHYALYLASAQLVAAYKDELAPYEISKGTIRFPVSAPVPVKLIEQIVKFRAKEIAGREKAKAAKKRPKASR
jgi:uncharacterized protein YdhG (YjbR/CyaY superfamily)